MRGFCNALLLQVRHLDDSHFELREIHPDDCLVYRCTQVRPAINLTHAHTQHLFVGQEKAAAVGADLDSNRLLLLVVGRQDLFQLPIRRRKVKCV